MLKFFKFSPLVRVSSLLRNSLYLIGTYGVDAVFGFFSWVIAARLYDSTQVGIASTVVSVIVYLAMLSTLGLEMSLVRFLPKAEHQEKWNKLNLAISLSIVISLVSATVFILGIPLWASYLNLIHNKAILYTSILLLTAALALITVLQGAYTGQRQNSFIFIQSIIYGAIKLIFLMFFALVLKESGILSAWGISYVIAALFSLLFLLPRLIGRPYFSITKSYQTIKGMLEYSLPNHVANLIWNVPIIALPLMIIQLLGPEQNAYFYIPWTLSVLAASIPKAVAMSVTAEGALDENLVNSYIRRGIKISLTILIPIVLILLVVGKYILLIFGNEYSQYSSAVFRFLILASIPMIFTQHYIAVKWLEKKPLGIIVINTFITLATVLFSYLIIKRFGIIGVAYSWVSAHTIGGLYAVFYLVRRMRLHQGTNKF